MKSIHAMLPLAVILTALSLQAADLPRLPKEVDPQKSDYKKALAALPDLAEAYVSTAPENLGDGLQVGKLDRPDTAKAVAALLADDRAGKFGSLDSILLWQDGKLIFEYYNRHGRVDAPHYMMSITKTMTSVALARAMQLGLLNMGDLDKPVISFMPEIDRSKIKPGVDTITLRDALYMKSGLRWGGEKEGGKEKGGDKVEAMGAEYKKQKYFEQIFSLTAPVTPKTKEYKYAGTDPSMIMMILDIKTNGKAPDFIKNEFAGKFGASYTWEEQPCGILKCGAGASFTSRSLIKIGSTILQGGKYNGEQLLSSDYVKEIMAANKGDGYFYYFHNENKVSPDNKIDYISGIGAGGQYMSIYPGLNLVAAVTADNKKDIKASQQAVLDHLIPLLKK